ncbi:hypothetical protein FPY71_10385 [Aureimonas fodinaquatilis]|uniref:Uncharacterized protein n=1 Tax=Aureimonas fodinaquatilis TaxID=2565783 RepID=A0A5B0DWX7_9HYPH|nr:hypothetical protein [Aureimonas fodinaquatilis]KAA0970868.1 hypothetical protein FPY71_10385 [Aureimonas fodinaquatilis]
MTSGVSKVFPRKVGDEHPKGSALALIADEKSARVAKSDRLRAQRLTAEVNLAEAPAAVVKKKRAVGRK